MNRSGTAFICASINSFSRAYWKFYAAAFCMDFGFGLYFFLFNIYLADMQLNERSIGQITACFTLGNVVGTIPAMLISRRMGLRPLLLTAFICVPFFAALRVIILPWPFQFILAFLNGAVLCGWPICFSPTIASVTNEENRSLGFSIAFATGIGIGSLAGVAGGYIPEVLHSHGPHWPLTGGIRAVLICSCAVILLGTLPLLSLHVGNLPSRPANTLRVFHPFLIRFLPAFMFWNFVTGSFPVFGAVYLQKVWNIPLGRLSAVFAASQLAQFSAVLIAPGILKRAGIAKGVAGMQICAALLLVTLAETRNSKFALTIYVFYFATQFMCGPGIYNLLMNRVPEEERSTASAFQNLSGATCQALVALCTGSWIMAWGYKSVLLGDAAVAASAAVLFVTLGWGDASSSDLMSDSKSAYWARGRAVELADADVMQ